ncbi:MAG TPA: DUF2092 domain-containing protein [Burkholderiaceae bacterium]|nr:DUF2092 domain-containing protein [Burkholderiaceae bacterium]
MLGISVAPSRLGHAATAYLARQSLSAFNRVVIRREWEPSMQRYLLALASLVLLLCASGGHAQPAQQAAPPTANAVDPASIQALKDMGAHLLSLKRFHVSTELTGERVLSDGQKLQHGARASMDVDRPNRIRVRMQSPRAERELFYDGKRVTLFTPAQKYYSTVAFTGTLGELVDKLEDGYGVELPLSDLFVWGSSAAPIDKIDSAMNAGQDFVDGDLCDHYAFRQGMLDWQIWISTGGKPLPRKLVITNRSDEARPQSVSIIDWNLKPSFNDASFTFKPPAGSKAIDIVTRKSK